VLSNAYNLKMINYLLIVLSSILFVAPFMNFSLWPLSWVCFIPLFYLFKSSKLSALRVGIIFGTIVTLIGTYWIPTTIVTQTGANYPISLLTHFLYSIYESVFYILVFLLFKFVSTKNYNKVYQYSLLIFFYIVLESYFPRIFPYRLGNSQILFQEVAQLISIFGLNILSILVLVANITIYELIFSKRTKVFVGFVLIVISIFYYGQHLIQKTSISLSSLPKVPISIIQNNNNLENLIELHNSIDHNPFLIIWPESSLDLVKYENEEAKFSRFEEAFRKLFKSTGENLIFGSISQITILPIKNKQILDNLKNRINGISKSNLLFEKLSKARGEDFYKKSIDYKRQLNRYLHNWSASGQYYFNTAFHFKFDRETENDIYTGLIGAYNKRKLMIFGEYYPFAPLISKVIPIYDSFVSLNSGGKYGMFHMPLKLYTGRDNKFRHIVSLTTSKGVEIYPEIMICYEDLFESKYGGAIMINLTNDWWYGDTLASYQHLMLSVPRTIETRRYLLRSTTNGISAVVDPTGKIVKKIEKNKKGIINYDVAYRESGYIYWLFPRENHNTNTVATYKFRSGSLRGDITYYSYYKELINEFYVMILLVLFTPLFNYKSRDGSD